MHSSGSIAGLRAFLTDTRTSEVDRSPFPMDRLPHRHRGSPHRGATVKAMLPTMAAFAQLERDTMIERTRPGLAAAAANGRKGGRPRKVDDADAAKARQLKKKGINATDIA